MVLEKRVMKTGVQYGRGVVILMLVSTRGQVGGMD